MRYHHSLEEWKWGRCRHVVKVLDVMVRSRGGERERGGWHRIGEDRRGQDRIG
jgi:hypothetical protein